jgi:hypothetical protein
MAVLPPPVVAKEASMLSVSVLDRERGAFGIGSASLDIENGGI